MHIETTLQGIMAVVINGIVKRVDCCIVTHRLKWLGNNCLFEKIGSFC